MKHLFMGSFAAAVIFAVIALTSGTAHADLKSKVLNTCGPGCTILPCGLKQYSNVARNANTNPSLEDNRQSTGTIGHK